MKTTPASPGGRHLGNVSASSSEGAPEGPAESKVVWLYEAAQKIYPRSVSGRFARLRWVVVGLTQLTFYGLPWLVWNARQAVLFDLAERKFYLFGIVLWPQDFIYLTGLLVICALTLFWITAVAGRLWCGYACPQTVYSEIFLWIERHTEGDRNARMRLDQGPWTLQKMSRKGLKHLGWGVLALLTGFTFVGYFEPIRELPSALLSGDISGWTLFWLGFYAFATWGNAGFMREQVCKYMCPYARFQSAMFDRDTLTVTYDTKRGEPRGSRARTADPATVGLGDCIDCKLCVQVCPTGIDIRHGLQYECIGCAACVDVCDEIMGRMDYPKGLIRYTTERALDQSSPVADETIVAPPSTKIAPARSAENLRHLWRPRTILYACLLTGIISLWAWGLASRNPLRVDVIRDRNALARWVAEDRIENVYQLQLMNSDETAHRYTIGVNGLAGATITTPRQVEVKAASNRTVPLRIQIPEDSSPRGSWPIEITIQSEDPVIAMVRERSVFIVPDQ